MKVLIGTDLFQLTGTYFGIALKEPWYGQEMRPAFRRDYEIRDVGPIPVEEASEETSIVVYEEFLHSTSTNKFFIIKTPTSKRDWALKGKQIIELTEDDIYFIETDGPNVPRFNGNNTIKTFIYSLRGDECKFVSKYEESKYFFTEVNIDRTH